MLTVVYEFFDFTTQYILITFVLYMNLISVVSFSSYVKHTTCITIMLLSIYLVTRPPTTPPPKPSTGGHTYVRWGNTSCPDVDGTSRVYEGRAASGFYNHNGGASDFVCLTSQGEYHPTSTTTNTGWAYMYGTEYHTAANQALTRDRQDHNVPCAVCEVDDRLKHLMMPGTYKCPSGWTTEYFG